MAQPVTVQIYIEVFSHTAQGLIEYHGWAQPSSSKANPVWRIAKFTYTGTNLTDIQFDGGNKNFDNIWNDRVTASYS